MSNRTSETLGRGFQLSAEVLDIQVRVWAWTSRLVFKTPAKVLEIKYPAKVFVKSGS